MTKNEKRAMVIARIITKGLLQLEQFTDDPAMVVDELRMQSIHCPQGVKEALQVLITHYEADS